MKILNFLEPIKGVSFHSLYAGNFKKKLIKANKIGSIGCIIIGEEELKENKIIWKNMESGSQEKIEINQINQFLKSKTEN